MQLLFVPCSGSAGRVLFVMLGIDQPVEVHVVCSRYLCRNSPTRERHHRQLVFVPVTSEIAKGSERDVLYPGRPGSVDRVVLCRGSAGRAAR